MKAIYTTDLHGHEDLYLQLAILIEEEKADALVLGGDLFPSGRSADQEGFFRKVMEPFLDEIETDVYAIMGNNDWRVHEGLLKGSMDLNYIHQTPATIAGAKIVGYNYVDITPFPLKDWEKWDNGVRTNPDDRLDGMVTFPRHADITFDPADRGDTIEKDLAELAGSVDPSRTIFVFHAPPFGTPLDMTPRGHCGSVSIQRFIEEHQPPITFHGHLHESVQITDEWFTLIGRTLSINPCQAGGTIHAVILDLGSGIARHTVYDGEAEFDLGIDQ